MIGIVKGWKRCATKSALLLLRGAGSLLKSRGPIGKGCVHALDVPGRIIVLVDVVDVVLDLPGNVGCLILPAILLIVVADERLVTPSRLGVCLMLLLGDDA